MGGAKKIVRKNIKSVVDPLGVGGKAAGAVKKNPMLAAAAFPTALGPLAAAGALPGQQGSQSMPNSGILGMSALEKKYGITRPEYESLRDESGALKSQFAYDPSKSAAFSKLREQAMAAPGDSPWAKMQLEKQGLEQSGLRDQAAQAALQGVAQQQSNLARFGGISGGARERLAASGVRGLARAQQDVARQGMMDRLGITEQDIGRQQSALGAVGKEELAGQERNLNALTGDVSGKSAFDMERYKEQMGMLGAGKTADAQIAAAKASKPRGLFK